MSMTDLGKFRKMERPRYNDSTSNYCTVYANILNNGLSLHPHFAKIISQGKKSTHMNTLSQQNKNKNQKPNFTGLDYLSKVI